MTSFDEVKNLFKNLHTPEEKYQKIIELGRELPQIDPTLKISENIVKGCQSIVYLSSEMIDGKIFFYSSSDALISAGLAALLIIAYNGQSPEAILQNRPTFLEDLQIYTSLSPGRANGIANIYLRMQQESLKYLANIS